MSERRASIERAKTIGASISAFVQEDRQRGGPSPFDAFKAFGASEMPAAARAVEATIEALLSGGGVPPRSSKKAAAAAAAAHRELGATLRGEESLRASQRGSRKGSPSLDEVRSRSVVGLMVQENDAFLRRFSDDYDDGSATIIGSGMSGSAVHSPVIGSYFSTVATTGSNGSCAPRPPMA